MASVREGARMASMLGRRQFPLRTAPMCARGFASTETKQAASPKAFEDIDSSSSFSTPAPEESDVEAFLSGEKAKAREGQLPGNRYGTPIET